MRLARPQQGSQPLWRKTRPDGVMPVALIVTIAVLSIVFAVLTSAYRADVVAQEHERRLLSNALADRQTQILREAELIASAAQAINRASGHPDAEWIARQLRVRLGARFEHIQALLVEPSLGRLQQILGDHFAGGEAAGAETLRALAPLLALMSQNGGDEKPAAGAVRIRRLGGRPAIVAAAPLAAARPVDAVMQAAPVLIIANPIDSSLLELIGAKLELPDLRLIIDGRASATDNVLEIRDESGRWVTGFAWRLNRPGAAIILDILPFMGTGLACFVLLAAFVLRYMRRTTATIAAGEDRLRHAAMHDPLSGLPNRILFAERLEALLADVQQGGARAALLSIDLDHFKDVNDTLGHHIGDELIGEVAQRLCRIFREDDLVARLGGDEFAVLTSGATTHAALETMGERIIETLSAPYLVDGHTLVIGASIGIVVIEREAHDAADILRFADMALYRAKNAGRNRACIYDAAMNADLTQRKRLENDLRGAIERDELALAYQPLVSPDGERVIGVEALCRWPHPRRGMVPPAEFVPVAEQSELIIPLGEWVLRRACIDGQAWPGVTVAVNVSPLQFRRPAFVQAVERILDETGFDPRRLELELTESTLLGNLDGAQTAMRRLKAMGVRLALDDFGTGYSSLLYLRRLPFDKLKIDRSFIQNLETAPEAAAIVHAIVSLGRGLGMKVTAEGVETAEQQLFLRAAGVHSMQGFRFGRPAEAGEVTKRLAVKSEQSSPGARWAAAG